MSAPMSTPTSTDPLLTSPSAGRPESETDKGLTLELLVKSPSRAKLSNQKAQSVLLVIRSDGLFALPRQASTQPLLKLIDNPRLKSPPRSSFFPCASNKSRPIHLSYQNILNCHLRASATERRREFELLVLSSSNSGLFTQADCQPPPRSARAPRVVSLKGFINILDQEGDERVSLWVETLMLRAYDGVPRSRRVLVIVNPSSGSGNGEKLWNTVAGPILKASPATSEVIMTTSGSHTRNVGESLDIDSIDVVAFVSGDGAIYDFINGLGRRPDAKQVFKKLNIAPIPAGSGNALATNQMGPLEAKNTHLGALIVLKGKPVPTGLCSITQPNLSVPSGEPIRSLSFLSMSFGLMADLDVGTNALRWMGSHRFILGFIRGALLNRYRNVRIDMKIIDDDKASIEKTWQQRRRAEDAGEGESDGNHMDNRDTTNNLAASSSSLPPLVHGDVLVPIQPNSDGWFTLQEEVTSVYTGTLPFMSPDLLEFPTKLVGDGSIDVVIHRSPNAIETLKMAEGASRGAIFKNKYCQCFKTKAIRLTPILTGDCNHGDGKKNSFVVVDGEVMPYLPIQIELHEQMTNVLSLQPRLGAVGIPEQVL